MKLCRVEHFHNTFVFTFGHDWYCIQQSRPKVKTNMLWKCSICQSFIFLKWHSFKIGTLTHERFLTIDHSSNLFWYLSNWTSTNFWCVVVVCSIIRNITRGPWKFIFVDIKNIFCRSDLWSKISHVLCSLKRFPHKFTALPQNLANQGRADFTHISLLAPHFFHHLASLQSIYTLQGDFSMFLPFILVILVFIDHFIFAEYNFYLPGSKRNDEKPTSEEMI